MRRYENDFGMKIMITRISRRNVDINFNQMKSILMFYSLKSGPLKKGEREEGKVERNIILNEKMCREMIVGGFFITDTATKWLSLISLLPHFNPYDCMLQRCFFLSPALSIHYRNG